MDSDPYSCINAPRKDAKLMLLIALNAKNRLAALRAFREDTDRWEPWVYDAIVAAHPAIAHYIGSDVGIKLQRTDSEIAERVLLHFSRQGIACIPIHDSFIVQERYEDELRTVMHESYKAIMGGYTCPATEA